MKDAVANQPLSKFTRFQTGGEAELYLEPDDTDHLKKFLRSYGPGMPIHILGGGSNILIRDGVVPGLVIRLSSDAFREVNIKEDIITCGAATPSGLLAKLAADKGLAGFEFLSCIPGTMGGALFGNAGCFGGEMKDLFVSATGIDLNTGEETEITPLFAYRTSGLPSNLLITSMKLRGTPADPASITAKMAELFALKSASQPVGERTAGSTFKNPADTPAWKLITDAGLVGEKVGGAEVSKLHANFIVNTGTATSSDIEDLAELIRSKVYAATGIMLEYEMKIIGLRA